MASRRVERFFGQREQSAAEVAGRPASIRVAKVADRSRCVRLGIEGLRVREAMRRSTCRTAWRDA